MRSINNSEFNDGEETLVRKRGGHFSGPFSKTAAGRDRRAERRRVRSGKSGI